MTTYGYNDTIPASGNNPANDQPLMKTNFASVKGIISEDHYTFGTAGSIDGFHKQITFAGNNPASPNPPGQVTVTPPVLFTNTVDGAGNALPNGVAELFFYSGTHQQGQDNYVSQSTGSVVLFGGIIMKWGQASVATGSNQGVNFGPSPGVFPNACFSVMVTGRNSGNNVGSFNVNGMTSTGFTVFCNNTGNIYWLAIGN